MKSLANQLSNITGCMLFSNTVPHVSSKLVQKHRWCTVNVVLCRVGLNGPLHSRILGFYPSALARTPPKPGPGGPDSSPPDQWKPSFPVGGIDDCSPGLEGRVGDQFWHPEGVQVKASNSRILISPPSNGPLSMSRKHNSSFYRLFPAAGPPSTSDFR